MNRTCSIKAVAICIEVRKLALPDIAKYGLFVWVILTPRIARLTRPASCSVFPFHLCWQSSTSPSCKCCGIVVRDLNDRVIVDTMPSRSWTVRAIPSCAINARPLRKPGRRISAGNVVKPPKHKRPAYTKCVGFIASISYKCRKFSVCHGRSGKPISGQLYRPDWSFPVRWKNGSCCPSMAQTTLYPDNVFGIRLSGITRAGLRISFLNFHVRRPTLLDRLRYN